MICYPQIKYILFLNRSHVFLYYLFLIKKKAKPLTNKKYIFFFKHILLSQISFLFGGGSCLTNKNYIFYLGKFYCIYNIGLNTPLILISLIYSKSYKSNKTPHKYIFIWVKYISQIKNIFFIWVFF